MPLYRKIPLIIHAEQWNGQGHDHPDVITKDCDGGFVCFFDDGGVLNMGGIVRTLEGDMAIRKGDYIITGIEGEKYPCKKSIFENSYELVEE